MLLISIESIPFSKTFKSPPLNPSSRSHHHLQSIPRSLFIHELHAGGIGTELLDARCQFYAFLDIKYLHSFIIACGRDEVPMNIQANGLMSRSAVAVCWKLVVGLGGRSWVFSIGVTEVVRAKLECQFNRRLGTGILLTSLFGPATTSRFSSMVRTWLRAEGCWILGSSLDASLLRSQSLTAPLFDPSRTTVGLSQSTAVTSWALSTGTRLLNAQPPSPSRSCNTIVPLDPATAKMQSASSGLAADAQ